MKSFANACRTFTGKPMKSIDLIDALAFINILFDSLEKEVKGTEYKDLVKNSFGFIFSSEIINDCSHNIDEETQCFHLNLSVKNKKNLSESLSDFMKSEMIKDYLCPTCKKKNEAIKRFSVKNPPNYLIISLRRIEFDLNTRVYLAAPSSLS